MLMIPSSFVQKTLWPARNPEQRPHIKFYQNFISHTTMANVLSTNSIGIIQKYSIQMLKQTIPTPFP